jgi:hypothetical protein
MLSARAMMAWLGASQTRTGGGRAGGRSRGGGYAPLRVRPTPPHLEVHLSLAALSVRNVLTPNTLRAAAPWWSSANASPAERAGPFAAPGTPEPAEGQHSGNQPPHQPARLPWAAWVPSVACPRYFRQPRDTHWMRLGPPTVDTPGPMAVGEGWPCVPSVSVKPAPHGTPQARSRARLHQQPRSPQPSDSAH